MDIKKEMEETRKHLQKVEARTNALEKLTQIIVLEDFKQSHLFYLELEESNEKTKVYAENKEYYNKMRNELKQAGADLSKFPDSYEKFLKTLK